MFIMIQKTIVIPCFIYQMRPVGPVVLFQSKNDLRPYRTRNMSMYGRKKRMTMEGISHLKRI